MDDSWWELPYTVYKDEAGPSSASLENGSYCKLL